MKQMQMQVRKHARRMIPTTSRATCIPIPGLLTARRGTWEFKSELWPGGETNCSAGDGEDEANIVAIRDVV